MTRLIAGIFIVSTAMVSCLSDTPPSERTQKHESDPGQPARQPAEQPTTQQSQSPMPTPLPVVPLVEDCLFATQEHCEIERLVTKYTNEYRANKGRQPLVHDPKITVIARQWSQKQAERRSISHSGFPRARFDAYFKTFNMRPVTDFYAENVAMTSSRGGEDVAKALVDMWYRSWGHRVNMLGKSYKTLGAGVYATNGGSYYATQIFGE